MAEVVGLARGWKLQDFAPGAGVSAGAHLSEYPDSDWLDVAVPGDVHRTLIDAGRIPDPFYDRNETACAWMEEREWWYRVHFDVPPEALPPDERQQLTFAGLDTFATIYLNGVEIGAHHNMFRPAVFDVTARLRRGTENVLAVRFDPPLQRIAGQTLSDWGRNPERTALRKAQFGFGWDWGPRLPTIGLWRPVELRLQRRAAVLGTHFSTLDLSPQATRAAVAVRVEAERFAGHGPLAARARLTPPGGGTTLAGAVVLDSEGRGTIYLTVDHPQLWWTHELGEPALYSLTITLMEGETELDRIEQKVGIRTLALDQSPDPAERGTRFFRFVLNGLPIFAKGADWIPCDSFVGAISPERYTSLLELARAANMTMLRVWGGGIYEHDHFYAECDRLGLLVWQDFMFACAMYPEGDVVFVAEVDAEARFQVRRLRSHACLALWCGNNENQWLHERRYWDHDTLPPCGELLYDSVLPRAVADLDGRTPYWPGSPFGGNDHNSRDEGNVHNWDVWHGNSPRRFGEPPRRENTPEAVSYRRYAEDTGRFVSEFGMHAAPLAETLWRVIPADARYQHSPGLDWHNKDNPKDKGDNLLRATTGLPNDLAQYILFSQIAQAEGLKFGVEHYRRRKPHCSGTLVWQLDDCWPVLSWSVLDYYGLPKAGYYFLRRAYAPVLASFKSLPDGALELWLTNDTAQDISDQVTVRLATFAMPAAVPVHTADSASTQSTAWRPLWQESRTLTVTSGANICAWRWSPSEVAPAPDRYVSVRSSAETFPANRHFFVDIKDLDRRPVAPTMTVTSASPNQLRVQLRAPAENYVYFAHLTGLPESTRFSDNYVDLEPGETRELVIEDPVQQIDPQALHLSWA